MYCANNGALKVFVVSDYTSLSEMINHGMGNIDTVSALALKAGLDMDMVSEGLLNTLQSSLQKGIVTQKQIDDACRRILEAKYKLGLFDDPYRYCNEQRAQTEIFTEENKKAAREFAEHSFVLLKNNNQLLPLKKSGTIALVGPLADSKRNMLGTWSVSGDPSKSVSVIEGIKNIAGNDVKIVYAKGCNISDDKTFAKNVNAFGTEIEIDQRTPEEMIKEAVDAASAADVIVAVMGEAADMTGEASSMSNIELQPSQKKFINGTAKNRQANRYGFI